MTHENINKDFSAHSIDSSTPSLKISSETLTLLTWLQTKVGGYGLVVTDMTSSFQNGLAICAIIHRYRPDLIEFASLDPTDITVNNQPAFDLLECELGISPITTGQEMTGAAEVGRPSFLDKLAMMSYLTLVCELFGKEIPYTVQPDHIPEAGDDLDDSGREKKQSIGQLVASEVTQRKKRRSVENEVREEEAQDENRYSQVSNKKRLAKLMERAAMQEKKGKETAEPKNLKIWSRELSSSFKSMYFPYEIVLCVTLLSYVLQVNQDALEKLENLFSLLRTCFRGYDTKPTRIKICQGLKISMPTRMDNLGALLFV